VKPGDRIEIKKRLAAALSETGWAEIDLILTEFNQPTTDQWSGDESGYIIEMLRQASDEDLSSLSEYVLGSGVAPPEDLIPWTGETFRLFLSHLAREKEFAGGVQLVLRWEGIDSFVAHTDIEPSAEWVRTIDSALRTCDALAAFLHEGFKESNWCDQEVGFVYGRRKPLIPVAIDLLPYGFLGQFQALKCWGETPHAVARKILEILLKRPDTRDEVIDAQLSAFVSAHSFDHANGISDRLSADMVAADWTPTRIAKVEAALKNSQVSNGFRAAPWAKAILQRHRQQSPPPPPSDSDDVPF
jgi:hypothetical protein